MAGYAVQSPSGQAFTPDGRIDSGATECAECGAAFVARGMFPGYAVRGDDSRICYQCAERAEIAAFLVAGMQGKPYVGYFDRDERAITTWTGGKLATITHVWRTRHNMARYMTHWQAVDAHGRHWYGKLSEDGGQLTRMRRAK